jgi:hypothetical protein
MCIKGKCCSELNGCANDTECAALSICVGQCAANDNACANNCLMQHPNGLNALTPLVNCSTMNCATECML